LQTTNYHDDLSGPNSLHDQKVLQSNQIKIHEKLMGHQTINEIH